MSRLVLRIFPSLIGALMSAMLPGLRAQALFWSLVMAAVATHAFSRPDPVGAPLSS